MSSPERALSVAIAGATGAVGEVLLRVLEERQLPVGRLLPLASGRSAGTNIRFRGEDVAVVEARPEAFEGIDLVFFAATGSLSKSLAPEAVARGAVVIDKSSTWRMEDDVPLVVPEINPEALEGHRGIVACPNCTTIGVTMALEPLRRAAGLRHVVVTTLQAVSGAGRDGSEELLRQLADASDEPRVFAAPIAHNAVPLCDAVGEGGSTLEEWKLVRETQKIFGQALALSPTCVRVPVDVGHSASLLVETERPLSPKEANEALAAFPGVEVYENLEEAPTARDVAGRDEVLVGRVRRDPVSERLWLWQVSDNLRKGAATNAVQIAEAMLERRLL